jgi:hypothetical protein
MIHSASEMFQGANAGHLVERSNGKLNAMHCLFWVSLLVSLPVRAQSVADATELLRKVQSFAESTRSWRAEVVETLQILSALL